MKDATAEKLFPDMTELLLMQANRRSPTLEPHPTALDGVPQQAGVDPQVMNGVPAQVVGRPQVRGHGPHRGSAPMGGGVGGAQRGTGGRAGDDAGRGASQTSQGGHHRGQNGPHMGHGISHVMNDSIEHTIHAPVGQRVAPPKEVAPSVQSDPRQARLTPAQFAIQQGKLQHQMERQLNPSQQQQQQQLAQLRHPQQQNNAQMQGVHELSSHQQQQQHEVRVSSHQASASAPQAQQAGMQGVQHSQWDSAFPDAVPRDPRQAPGNSGTGIASSSWQADQGQQPGWLHSRYRVEARPGFGHQDAQPSAAHRGPHDPSGSHVMESSQQPVNFPHVHHEAGAMRNDAFVQSGLAPSHMGGGHARPAAMPEMPAIPSGNAHHVSSRHDHMEIDQQCGLHMAQNRQSPMYAGQVVDDAVDLVAVPRQKGSRRDPALSHASGSAKDPRRMHRTQSNGFAPAAPQLASPTHLGRNGLQHSAETPQVPQWTNNRR